ncbi:hypothetical protein [Rathayibacter soli]|uniref:hypothetical protein n=1 Tax=Rathayibacter soli TaxID=3144168 RepID=UPI0027E512EC|nr:hypothetical protein [Glaciibacter superstes]
MPLLEQAARDNAEWCEALVRSHGIRSRFTADAWIAASRTPPTYPDAVTLRRSASRELLTGIDASDGCSVKDSFAALDLSGDGFDVLLDARWIYRAPAREHAESGRHAHREAGPIEGLSWSVLERHDLHAWATLHPQGAVFRQSLLTEPGIVLLRADAAGALAAGAVLSHTGAIVGVSNVVATQGFATESVWPGIVDQVSRLFPGLGLVGYESGADLIAPLGAGFSELGDLRVWVR